MSDIKAEVAHWKTVHNMTDRHAGLYEIFCMARAETRASETKEDAARRADELEAAKQAPDDMNITIVHKNLENKTE